MSIRGREGLRVIVLVGRNCDGGVSILSEIWIGLRKASRCLQRLSN